METDNPHHIQKNWSPFLYYDDNTNSNTNSNSNSNINTNSNTNSNPKIYFIKSIHPLLDVEMKNYSVSFNNDDDDNEEIPCKQVSLFTCHNLQW